MCGLCFANESSEHSGSFAHYGGQARHNIWADDLVIAGETSAAPYMLQRSPISLAFAPMTAAIQPASIISQVELRYEHADP